MALSKDVTEIVTEATLASGSTTALADCTKVDLSEVAQFTLTTRCTFDGSASSGVTMHVRSSPDGTYYDTEDVGAAHDGSFTASGIAGSTVQETAIVEADFKYAKVLVENLDGSYAVTTLTVDSCKQTVEPT